MPTPASDAQPSDGDLGALLSRTALGDRAAFRRLYDQTSSQLLGVILRIHRDRVQAEDVLQEVFVKIWGAAGSFDAQRAQPMTWLVSIARHRAIDSLRRRQTEPTLLSTNRPGDGDDDADHDLLDHVPSSDAGPHELLDRALEARVMKACMDCLSGEQKQCLALAFYDGLSHAEVAGHLEQPLGTVKSWVRRGLQALRRCLQRAGAVEPAVA